MQKNFIGSSPLTRLLLLCGLVVLALAGFLVVVGQLEVQANQPQEPALVYTNNPLTEESLEYNKEFTATYEGNVTIEYEGAVIGSTTVQLVQPAPLTTTVVIREPGTGAVVVTSTVGIETTVPVTVQIEGMKPYADEVTIKGSEAILMVGKIERPNTDTPLVSTDQPWTEGGLVVTGTGKFTVTGAASFTGTAPAFVTAFLTYDLYLPYTIKSPPPQPTPPPGIWFYDDFSDPNSGWPRGCSGYCCYNYVNGMYDSPEKRHAGNRTYVLSE